jgi:hypothetical protein
MDYKPSMLELPRQFQVDKSVLFQFYNDFKEHVYEEAIRQQFGDSASTSLSVR